MNNNKKPIPHRVYNPSKEHPYVAGAVDIIDDRLNQNQQDVNAGFESAIAGFNDQNYYTVEATDADTSIESIMSRAGVVPAKDTVYRVGFWDGEQYDESKYSEYAWNESGNTWKLLDVKEYTLATADDFIEPDAEMRAKVVPVGAAADVYGAYEDNPEFVEAKLDAGGKILEATKINGTKSFPSGIETSSVSMESGVVSSIDSPEFIELKLTSEEHILEGIQKDGTKLFGGNVKISGKQVINGVVSEAVSNPEWIYALTDKSEKILEGITSDGVKKVMVPTEFKSMKNLDTDIISWYPTETMGVMLENLRLGVVDNNGVYYYNGQTYNYPPVTPLTLLWFSDIHENAENLQRISKFFNTYKDKLDDVIFTGDVTLNTFQTFNDNYWPDNGGNDFLFCIGNHDAAISLSPYQPASPKQTYEKYLLPYINNTNVICQTNKNYWYKDYSEAKSPECPGGIRLISIDQYHWKEGEVFGTESYEDGSPVDTGQQEQWLIDTLEDARINGLAVIMAMHGSAVLLTNVQCSFNNPSKAWSHNYTETRLDMLNAVQTFIDAGGEFICWISGHWHQDWVGNIQHLDANGENVISYPQQTQIVISTASYSMPWRDIHMIKDTKSMDCFNIFHVDTLRKWILLFRVGVDVDKYGRHIGSLVYDYRNKNIIFNN